MNRAITRHILRIGRVFLCLLTICRISLLILIIRCRVICHVLVGCSIVLLLRWAGWIFYTFLFWWAAIINCSLIAGWWLVGGWGFWLGITGISWGGAVCRLFIFLFRRSSIRLRRITIRISLLQNKKFLVHLSWKTQISISNQIQRRRNLLLLINYTHQKPQFFNVAMSIFRMFKN